MNILQILIIPIIEYLSMNYLNFYIIKKIFQAFIILK